MKNGIIKSELINIFIKILNFVKGLETSKSKVKLHPPMTITARVLHCSKLSPPYFPSTKTNMVHILIKIPLGIARLKALLKKPFFTIELLGDIAKKKDGIPIDTVPINPSCIGIIGYGIKSIQNTIAMITE